MSLVKKLSTALAAMLLIVFFTLSAALPALAISSNSRVQGVQLSFNVEENLSAQNLVSQNNGTEAEKELRRSTIVEKLVCRYINGQKRCWDD